MSLPTYIWSCRTNAFRQSSSILTGKLRLLSKRDWRFYATHRDSESLSQSLDTKRSKGPYRAGPFPLGAAPAFRGENPKKWSELSGGGKVKRATARTSNFAVVLLGAGLSAVLLYVLTTELVSSNSPTVLHEEACERIRKSSQVAKYLHGPLIFYNTPPSVDRPRSRMGSHQIASEVVVDASGRSHMFLNFYVQGRHPAAARSSDSWIQNAVDGLPEMNVDSVSHWLKLQTHNLKERSRSLFRYLIGAPLPPPVPSTSSEETSSDEKRSQGWQIAGIFSSLRRATSAVTPQPGAVFTDGEVHAMLIMNEEGKYVFNYLFVDIPGTHDPRRYRVWVERAKGVQDEQAAPRWYREKGMMPQSTISA